MKFADIASFDTDKIKELTSENALQCYEMEYMKFADIASFDVERIIELTSKTAYLYYQRDLHFDTNTTTDQMVQVLLATDYHQYNSISRGLRDTVLYCHILRYASIEQCQNLDPTKAELLMSDNAIKCYKKGYCTFDALSSLAPSIIIILTSKNALACYDKSLVDLPVTQLSHIEKNKLLLLFSRDALASYEAGLKFDILKDCDVDKIRTLITMEEPTRYSRGVLYHNITYHIIINYDASSIRALTSENALQCYEIAYMKFADIASFDTDKIKALTTSYMDSNIENMEIEYNITKTKQLEIQRARGLGQQRFS